MTGTKGKGRIAETIDCARHAAYGLREVSPLRSSARAERSVPDADGGRIRIDPTAVETRRAKYVLLRPAGSLLHPIPNADTRGLGIDSRSAVETARAILRTFATDRGSIRTDWEQRHYKNH